MDNMITIKENKTWEAESGPRFILRFNEKASKEQKRKNSYDVLSKLIGSSDVIVELNGTLLNLPSKQRDSHASEFIENIKALGLEYRCSKETRTTSPSLLNLLGKKTTQEQVVVTYIPNEIWSNPEMIKLISFYGAKYFVLKEKSEESEALDYFQRLQEDEQVDYYKAITFDAMSLSGMGIFTKHYELSDIKGLLGIS
jgi:hypothetical protein